ncbi:peptide chain release factor 1 (RF-1) [Salmonella enterica subsp. arizonae]|uniref:Peptide chain release factor 1 (RF-1) n=1 Tax=Salmonella enterica subsp. arizonae TaxID=59203 RepID=A0A2X4T9R5_SALER|nr:peptide chain release factor 1 (RF-1) [Salmonella enterica subsp. arizonae]
MKPSIVAKLEALHERHEEVQALLGDAGIIADQDRFRALSREYAQLSDVSRCFTDWQQVQDDIETAQMMLDDPEMREMAQEELREAKEKSEQLEQQLQVLLLPKDPDDERTRSLRFAPALAATKPRCLPAICSACTAVMPKRAAGVWRS